MTMESNYLCYIMSQHIDIHMFLFRIFFSDKNIIALLIPFCNVVRDFIYHHKLFLYLQDLKNVQL